MQYTYMKDQIPMSLYAEKRTARFAAGEWVKEFQGFEQQARKRLLILDSATSRRDLMLLPSNRFEALGGDRAGQYSIRINEQWRICFKWADGDAKPFAIEIVDYH
jgi:proteic killer suppression protein